MNDLLEVAQVLRSRISVHRPALNKSETLTRYALIDPLLRALGWNPEDPSKVVPEYPSTGGRADYALLDDKGKPLVMVEAKKLGESLEKWEMQGIQYCLEKGTLYFVLTDGQRWQIYETHKAVPIGEKRIISFDLGGSVARACRKALAIWRPCVIENSLESAPPPLSFQRSLDVKHAKPSRLQGSDSSLETGAASGKQSDSSVEESIWLPLPETIHKVRSGQKVSPLRFRFPDNSTFEVTYWWQILRETARWLYEKGQLTQKSCPIQRPKSTKRYVVATEPIHPSGKRFVAGTKVGALHAETHASGAGILANTELVISHVGADPSRFQVCFRKQD